MVKIPRTLSDLQDSFEKQLSFIEKSSIAYDSGDLDEAVRIATHIRTLFHHTSKSISLLSQLGLDTSTKFINTKLPDFPPGPIIVYHGLISTSFRDGHYVPILGTGPTSFVDFETFWEKDVVVIDKKGNKFTRKTIVGFVADTDGGAHVDPGLDKEYADLSRNNSLGWFGINSNGETNPLYGAALASIRQIGYEILRTFNRDYNAEHKQKDDIHISGMQIVTEPVSGIKVGRNKPCPCGSGKKWKHCGYLNKPAHIQAIDPK